MTAWAEGRCLARFVVVATMQRGVLEAPELLDDANQWRAFSAWLEDEGRKVRTDFELRYDDARVIWAKEPARDIDGELGRRVG